MTRISIGLPVYNGERWLAGAITSLLEQSHRDLEIVISDNGSSDATADICRDFAGRDDRIRYIRLPRNMGAVFNHNFVLRESTAPYFRWYAYDDFMDPECLKLCADALDAADDATVLAWGRTIYLDADDTPIGDSSDGLYWDDRSPTTRVDSLLGRPTDESLIRFCEPIYAVMRREPLLATKPYASYPAADGAQLVELAMRGRWAHVPAAISYRRRHEDSSAYEKTADEVAEWLDPGAQGGPFLLPWTKLFLGYLLAVWHSGAPVGDRLRSTRVVLRWVRQERGWYPGDVRWRLIASEWKAIALWPWSKPPWRRGRRSA